MRTYKEIFDQAEKAALIPFFVIGDPDINTSFEIVKTAIDAGADILELGIPFSDPIADGPTIQKADIRALKNKMTMAKALEFIRQVKQYKDIPIGLLIYYNLMYQYGIEKFCKDFHQAGVNSVLVADLNVDDAEEIQGPAKEAGLDTVFMVTPNCSDKRIAKITEKISGFVYTVSLLGVTGGRETLSDKVSPLVAKLKTLTDVPVCVGFGISKTQHAAEVVKAGADGVIVGSAIIKIIETNLENKEKMLSQISEFITEMKQAIAGAE
jgi:tryptophan synthase alpha chain